MKFDFVYKNNSLSTYFDERGPICSTSYLIGPRYKQVEKDVKDCLNYQELVQRYEIKTLDSTTGLKELKIDRIRVIHFIYHDDTFVYLGTFLKKTRKTPTNEMKKNNSRIQQYLDERTNKNERWRKVSWTRATDVRQF